MSKREEMESVIRRYFEGCNEGSVDKIASAFCPPRFTTFHRACTEVQFTGGRTIGERWSAAVSEMGSQWALECLAIDVDTNSAVSGVDARQNARGYGPPR